MEKKPQIPILFFLFSLANVLGVLYTAALPNLSHYFQISRSQAQQTVGLYLIGCLLGQVVYAPLANALGRKIAIYIGCSLSSLGSLLCILAIETTLFPALLWGRVLTAFGASCGLVLTNTIIAESFSLKESKKLLSLLMMGFAIFPAAAISLGGFITEYFSWKDCFYLMGLYSIVVLLLCIFLPETGKERHINHLKISKIAKSYSLQLRNPIALLYAWLVGAAAVILYDFAAEAPFIAITQLHVSPTFFGLYNLIPSVGLLLGGIAAAHLSLRISSKNLLLGAATAFFLFSLAMWILFALGFANRLFLFGIPFLIFFVTPALLSHGQALSIAASQDKAYASSTLYIIQYFYMFLSINLLRLLKDLSDTALPIAYSLSGAFMLLLWLLLHYLEKDTTPLG